MKVDLRIEELIAEIIGYDEYAPSIAIWDIGQKAIPAIRELIAKCEKLEQQVENLGYEIKEIYSRNDL